MSADAVPLDLKRLVAEVSAQHNIRIDQDDPMVAVITLNKLMFEAAVAETVEQVRVATKEFEQAVERVQVRAGAAIANELREATASCFRSAETKTIAESVQGSIARTPPHANIVFATSIAIAFILGLFVGILIG